VTNPTHLAVAIIYEKDVTPLPIVLAKGEGLRAYRIAAVAREHGIPVLQNIPLARALMAHAALNQYIPSDLIEPVAEVLRLVREMQDSEGTPL
jgi:type III secretion protein U